MNLHDPYAIATPTQRLAAAARNERLAKIRNTAAALNVPKFIEPPSIIPEDKDWAERQKQIPIRKAPWFHIEAELGPVEPMRPLIEDIQRAVARKYNITRDAMISPRRTENISKPRQVAMFLVKEFTIRSLPEIGRKFGGRDHTTILHGVRKIARLITIDPELLAEVEAIRAELRS